MTSPCTLSPKTKTPSSPTPDRPTKKIKLSSPTPKKNKVTRKLNSGEDNSSPVSGTIIKNLAPDEHLVVRKGDIDPAFNVVEITEEAKTELARIENHMGDYVCRLCKELYEDAFGLSQHRNNTTENQTHLLSAYTIPWSARRAFEYDAEIGRPKSVTQPPSCQWTQPAVDEPMEARAVVPTTGTRHGEEGRGSGTIGSL
ncbi:hypothetical protein GWI33_007654 [Rhynchophorus ferrugineus]|uniref:C2H2-type domain-containing protein n=1 Tax=Rhynchophorus ferrugineus TaxID=354439 RepID=A0A834MCT7_RHYFE|nr:hypothetical protein GWI33_007654 [Rhynchophorus ferrugineus]